MIDLKDSILFIENLNIAAKSHHAFYSQTFSKAKERKKKAEKEAGDFNCMMQKHLDTRIGKSLAAIRTPVNNLLESLKEEYEAQYREASKAQRHGASESIDACVANLKSEVAVFNSLVLELGKIDLDGAYPAKKILLKEETFEVSCGSKISVYETFADQKLAIPQAYDQKLIGDIFASGLKVLALADDLADFYAKKADLPSLIKENEALLRDYKAKVDEEAAKAIEGDFKKGLGSPEFKKTCETFFKSLDDDASEAMPDPDSGSEKFKQSIQMGFLQLPVCAGASQEEQARIDTLREVDILKERVGDNVLDFPLIASLKKKGNVLLTLKSEEENSYPELAERFVNQLIISFVLSFPCSRVHLKLVDIGNKMGFSSLAALQKVSGSIFEGGIVRDEEDLDEAIKTVKKLKLSAEDKLNLDAMPNVFAYNKKMEASPMDVYLFVLIDFPSKITVPMAKDILHIVKNGKDYGVFSVITINSSGLLEYDFEKWDCSKMLETLFKVSYIFSLDGEELLYREGKSEYRVGLLPSITKKNLAHIVEVLSKNVHTEVSKPIPLAKMLEYMDGRKAPDISNDFEIPFGMAGADVEILQLGSGPHSAVIGGTGSGKSIFFHTLILDACYWYSPEELNFYLLDFKGGMEFSYYKDFKLPHIKLIGLTKDMNDGLSIFANLRDEMRRRMKIFASEGADDIESYCKKGNGKKIPRLFVIIDEIQEIFREEGISEKALSLLSEILAQGRACGINVLWGSQSVPSVPGFDNAIMQNIANRICLKVEDIDYARRLFSEGAKLQAVAEMKAKPEKGYGVISDQKGAMKEFRVAYSEKRENRGKYHDAISKKWAAFESESNVYVLGEDLVPDVKNNGPFAYDPRRDRVSSKVSEAYPLKIGTSFVSGLPYSLDVKLFGTNSNVVYLGAGDGVGLLRDLMGFSLLSVLTERCLDSDCLKNSGNKVYYVNKEVSIDPKLSGDLYNSLLRENKDSITNVSSFEKFKGAIKELYAIYLSRMETLENGELLEDPSSYFVFIHYLQAFADALEKNEPLDDGGYSFDGSANDSLGVKDAFLTLLKKGGDYGIHFIVSVNGSSLDAVYPARKELSESAHKVTVLGADARSIASSSTGRAPTIENDKICVCCANDSFTKIRPYRFDEMSESDAEWRRKTVDAFKNAAAGGEGHVDD